MARLTLAQCAQSRLPEVLGVCSADLPSIATAVNAAQERLIFAREAQDEGFYGSFCEMGFNVLKCDPYIALGRYGARIMYVDVCHKPIQISNQFEEYLRFGDGRHVDQWSGRTKCSRTTAFARGVSPTYRDMTPGHKIRIRAEDPTDIAAAKRVLIQGTDTADGIITSLDVTLRVQGIYVVLESPFVDTPFALNSISGIQKDPTNGRVQFWDVEPATGVERLILVMEGGEMVAGYPRWYFRNLPLHCCQETTICGQPTVQVTALVKLNLIPVIVPTDYLLIQSMEAIIAECQSLRYSTMDLPASKQMSLAAHKDAIRLLNGELAHYYGTTNPSVSVKPFGSANLERQGIGLLI